ncbi:MAG: cysteine hydrolase [Deltaproteobacteria bacterium]|nr:cysteine hydrolase [Deltaproteobacteria bacterium]
MTKTRAAGVLICILALGVSACIKPRLPLRGSRTTLVLLNYQTDYLRAQGRMPVAQDQVGGLIKATNKLIGVMRQQPNPVIYTLNEFSPFQPLTDVGQDFSAMRFEAGSALDPRINYLGGVYFSNQDWDAFTNSQFERHLQLIGAGHLVLAGTHPERAVLDTAREAKRRGYAVTVISDAVASSDTRRRDAALNALKGAGVEVETSDQFIAALGQQTKS